jgi:hypothetical protein
VLCKRHEHAAETPVPLHGLKIAGIDMLGLHVSRLALTRNFEIETHWEGSRYFVQKAIASVWRLIARTQLLPLHERSAKVVLMVRARIRVSKISIAGRVIILYLCQNRFYGMDCIFMDLSCAWGGKICIRMVGGSWGRRPIFSLNISI